MFSFLSYLVLFLFLGGSLYLLGLMFYILLTQAKGKVKPLNPRATRQPDLHKAA